MTAKVHMASSTVRAIFWGIALAALQANGSETDISDIVEKVRSHEVKYRNIEFVIKMTLTSDLAVTKRSAAAIQSSTGRIRYVSQGDLFYFRRDEEAFGIDGQRVNMDLLMAYDGVDTRILEQGLIGKVYVGRKEPRTSPRPHTMALQNCLVTSSLSDFLATKEYFKGISHAPAIIGEELYNGLHCLKIRDEYGRSHPTSVRIMWLAIERNYIPVRCDSYFRAWSETLPHMTARVPDLRELAPGVWFPWRMVHTLYASEKLPQGQAIPYQTIELKVEEAALEPHHALDFFRNVLFSRGSPLYEIQDGQIMRKYQADGCSSASAVR